LDLLLNTTGHATGPPQSANPADDEGTVAMADEIVNELTDITDDGDPVVAGAETTIR
jgi:hypothetical protein